MIAFETADNWAWSVDVTVGAATETFTNLATDADAVAALQALVTWANAGGRAWTGTRVFSWAWIRHAASGAALLTLSATGGAFSLTAGALTTLGFAAVAGVTSTTGAAAAGTWAPALPVSLRRNVRLLDSGDAGGNGAVRPGVPGLACRLPKLDAMGTATDAARLSAVLAAASSPRRAQVWQLHTSSWIELAVGAVSRSAQGSKAYEFAIEVAGDPV
jgi:hypothetical protein